MYLWRIKRQKYLSWDDVSTHEELLKGYLCHVELVRPPRSPDSCQLKLHLRNKRRNKGNISFWKGWNKLDYLVVMCIVQCTHMRLTGESEGCHGKVYNKRTLITDDGTGIFGIFLPFLVDSVWKRNVCNLWCKLVFRKFLGKISFLDIFWGLRIDLCSMEFQFKIMCYWPNLLLGEDNAE